MLYTTADQLLRHLHARPGRRLDRPAPPALPRPRPAGHRRLRPQAAAADGPVDLYDVINGRYEKGSIVVTSNRAPAEWPDLFGDPLLANAGLDRLGHRATVLLILRRSFRMADRPTLPEVPMTTT